MRNRAARTTSLALAGLLVAGLAHGQAIDRAEVMDRARAFAFHPWPCSPANLTASCTSGYQSDYVVGDHLGLPYDWGNWVSLHRFDQEIDSGFGAGSPAGGDVLSCTTGLDCSGFVSQCWDQPQKYGTWTILDVASIIDPSQLQAGDALNYPGYHIVIYAEELADGTLITYEANPPNTHLNWFSSWAGVNGFDPIRYNDIQPAASDYGSLSNPIAISFPFQDTRDTSDSPSDLFDACGAAPGTDESGREYVYAFTITQPGQLTATVSDGNGVDIDLHLYTHAAERNCIARHDYLLDLPLTECGTYLLVLDTWVTSAGAELAGPYTLSVSFAPSGGSCQPMDEFAFEGGPGAACAYPGSPALPFCNPNLSVVTCLYSTGADPFSFCSRSCGTDGDCQPDFPSGCCEDIGSGDRYCLPSEYCAGSDPDGGEDGGVDGGEDGSDDGPADGGGDGELEDAGGDDSPADGGVDGGADASDGEPADGGGDGDAADAGGDAGPADGGADQTPADKGACPTGFELYDEACVPLGWRPEDGAAGCGCGAAGNAQAGAWLPLALAALWALGRRRRHATR